MTVGTYESNLDGEGLRIGIVQARFNDESATACCRPAWRSSKRLGVADEDVLHVTVPGALEIPLALQKMAETQPVRRADRARRGDPRRDLSLRTGVERIRRRHHPRRPGLRHPDRQRGADHRNRRAGRSAHGREGRRCGPRRGRNGEPGDRARRTRRRGRGRRGRIGRR